MRTQDCREKLQWILDHCPIGEDAKREIEKAAEFCELHPTFVGLPTKAIMPLIREPDEETREKAISSVSKSIELKKNPITGRFTNHITEKDVRQTIEKAREQKSVPTFNRTNDNIEWAKWSWNPVTGCKHGCEYCYARDMANRFYKEKFEPTFRPERLDAPKNTPLPKEAETSVGYKNVFVCSMADLFGDWVPKEWIDAVLKVVEDNQQWNFLFLTKNPIRYLEFEFPINAWLGTTVDRQDRVEPAEKAFRELLDLDDCNGDLVRFLSCEPLLEPLRFSEIYLWSWLIIGGCSGNSRVPASQPEWDWVEHLLNQARHPCDIQCDYPELQVYFKPNLTARPKEYPDEVLPCQ